MERQWTSPIVILLGAVIIGGSVLGSQFVGRFEIVPGPELMGILFVWRLGVGVFLAPMVNRVVASKLVAELGVASGLIGHDVAFAFDVLANNRHNLVLVDAFDMERAGDATPFNEGKDGILVVAAAPTSKPSFRPM